MEAHGVLLVFLRPKLSRRNPSGISLRSVLWTPCSTASSCHGRSPTGVLCTMRGRGDRKMGKRQMQLAKMEDKQNSEAAFFWDCVRRGGSRALTRQVPRAVMRGAASSAAPHRPALPKPGLTLSPFPGACSSAPPGSATPATLPPPRCLGPSPRRASTLRSTSKYQSRAPAAAGAREP